MRSLLLRVAPLAPLLVEEAALPGRGPGRRPFSKRSQKEAAGSPTAVSMA